VNLTAADKTGNRGNKSFSVTVQDTTAPVIAPRENLVIEAQGPQGAVATFTLSASDLVTRQSR